MSNHNVIKVNLQDRSYPITIGSALLSDGLNSDTWIQGKDCLIVTNETVAPLYLDVMKSNIDDKTIEVITIKDGEHYKTIDTWSKIIDKLTAMRANRDTTIIALGGGVLGDIAGFAAATFMRGLPFIQVPTTLLAQVDSSVGGKTGVNHKDGKNLIGSFYQPRMVISDIDVLSTLPDREYKCGLAEIIKYGAIYDVDFFAWLESNMSELLNRVPKKLIYAISRSCQIKANIVGEDEFEIGKRAILNFGHTFGHALENIMGYGELLHGEAVAIGMIIASKLSPINSLERNRLISLIKSANLPHKIELNDEKQMLDVMKTDKKVKNKKLRFVLLRSLGEAFVEEDLSEKEILDAINNPVS
ncbi:MAG: 3-dehydroquinate synthase [Woeseiaceae bacterium]